MDDKSLPQTSQNGVQSIAQGNSLSEYEEYLQLNEVFVGDKLQRLVRKVE